MGDPSVAPGARPSPGPAVVDAALGWLKGRERAVLMAAAAFQIAVLAAMIVLRALPLLFGETILLRVVPVDPRDLFRGDYVILSYEFSRRPPEAIQGLPRGESEGEDGGGANGACVPGARQRRPALAGRNRHHLASPRGRYLRGRIAAWGQLEFGIEAYSGQEGRGREYEQAIRHRRLSAEVALTSDGTAALRGLRIE